MNTSNYVEHGALGVLMSAVAQSSSGVAFYDDGLQVLSGQHALKLAAESRDIRALSGTILTEGGANTWLWQFPGDASQALKGLPLVEPIEPGISSEYLGIITLEPAHAKPLVRLLEALGHRAAVIPSI